MPSWGVVVRLKALAALAGVAISAIATTGCAPEVGKTPTEFAGLWTSATGSNQTTCGTKPIYVPFSSYTILLRAGVGQILELAEVDQTDYTTEYCVYQFEVSANTASLIGMQTCTTDYGSGTPPSSTSYTHDVLTLSHDDQSIRETSASDDGDGCHTESFRQYGRGHP